MHYKNALFSELKFYFKKNPLFKILNSRFLTNWRALFWRIARKSKLYEDVIFYQTTKAHNLRVKSHGTLSCFVCCRVIDCFCWQTVRFRERNSSMQNKFRQKVFNILCSICFSRLKIGINPKHSVSSYSLFNSRIMVYCSNCNSFFSSAESKIFKFY